MQVKEPSVVNVNSRKFAYDEVSPPNPKGALLLINGLGANRLGWSEQLAFFGQYYRTIAFDNRDVGDSDYVNDIYTTDDQADDAAALLKALGINRAHIMGISMGGFISLHFALLHPEMVDKLVLVSTSSTTTGDAYTAPGEEIMAMLTTTPPADVDPGDLARGTMRLIMAPGFIDSHPEIGDIIAEAGRYRPQAYDGYMRQLQACMAHDVSARLGEIRVPTLVVHGDVDPLVRYENGKYIAERIPGAKLVTYKNVGHIPITEVAEDFNRDVLTFLES